MKIERTKPLWMIMAEQGVSIISGGDGTAPPAAGVAGFDVGISDGSTGAQQVPEGIVVPAAAPPAAPAVNDGQTFTVADIERVRREEKDKLYGQLGDLKGELSVLREREEARLKAEEERAAQLAEEERKAAEEAMTLRQRLEAQQAEFDARFQTLEQNAQMAQAALEQERRYSQLVDYRTAAIAQAGDAIMPHLIDFIGGNSEEEINASIQIAAEKSAAILGDVQASIATARMGTRTVSPTAPPVGPMEMQEAQRTLMPADIANMTPAEYAANRQAILAGMRNRVQQHGIYGG